MLIVRRAEKIKSGLRMTSFQFLLNEKHGPIGRMLRAVNPQRAELYFMMGQFGYSIVTELPAVFVLYNSKLWSVVFLTVIFAASAWNGGGYYIEVFGRKFERELEALRKELATAQSQSSYSGHSSPFGFGSSPGSPQVGADMSPVDTPDIVIDDADLYGLDINLRKRAEKRTLVEDVVNVGAGDMTPDSSVFEAQNGNGLQLFDDTKKSQ